MQLIKFFLFICFGFPFFLNAQPSPTNLFSDINISFQDCNKKLINFQNLDSTQLKKDKYRLRLSLIDIEGKETPLVFGKETDWREYCFYESNKKKVKLKNIFKIKYNLKVVQQFITKIVFTRKKKTMIILIDITDCNQDLTIDNIDIHFQKGIFKITDPYNPTLIPIKDD